MQLRAKTNASVVETSLEVFVVGKPLDVSLDCLDGLSVASRRRARVWVAGKEVHHLHM